MLDLNRFVLIQSTKEQPICHCFISVTSEVGEGNQTLIPQNSVFHYFTWEISFYLCLFAIEPNDCWAVECFDCLEFCCLRKIIDFCSKYDY